MAQIGEFSFIIAALGVSLKVTTDQLYPLIVAVAGITTFTTPYFIRLSGYIDTALTKHLPKRIQYFLESYSSWVYRTLSSSQKNSLFSRATIRLIINGFLVAIIFTFIHYSAIREWVGYLLKGSGLINLTSLLLSLLVSSPFIWGMLFSINKAKLPDYAKTSLNPAVFMIWLITLSEITILSIVYFHTWFIMMIFFAIGIVFFLVAYKHLELSYHWFEEQLIRNLKTNNQNDQSRYAELAPWDTHLVEVEVGEKSPFVGKSLGESQIRQRYGVNIVAISHGSRVIPAPRGEEKIFSHDRLVVLGNDKQIEAFQNEVSQITEENEEKSFLDNFVLAFLLLDSHHTVVGETIRSSKLRERVNGMIVGIERDNKRILNPAPDTVLQADDLLLVVGEVDKINRLNTWD